MVWQPLPCDNGKYVWQGYKGEPIVTRAASAVTALHSTSKLVSTNHSLFFHIWCPLSAPEALTAHLRTDSWPCWCCAVQKRQTMLRFPGRQCQLFVIFQMLSWKVLFLLFFQLWKFSQVAILKLEHCVFFFFCIWKLIYSESKPCIFGFSFRKICASSVDFSKKTKSKYSKILVFQFFFQK